MIASMAYSIFVLNQDPSIFSFTLSTNGTGQTQYLNVFHQWSLIWWVLFSAHVVNEGHSAFVSSSFFRAWL